MSTVTVPETPDTPAQYPGLHPVSVAACEQIMRICADEAAALDVLYGIPGTNGAHATLGRFSAEHDVTLTAGCPLMAFVTGEAVNPYWRASYPARQGSLHAELQMLTAVLGNGTATTTDPLAQLIGARRQGESVFPECV